MHFQLLELHVQHAIRETILHVRASKCMSMCKLHVHYAICLFAEKGNAFGIIIFMSARYNCFGYAYPKVICMSDKNNMTCWIHIGHDIVKSKIMMNMGMLFLFSSQTWSCVSQHTNEGRCLKGFWCLLWSKTIQNTRRCFASAGT